MFDVIALTEPVTVLRVDKPLVEALKLCAVFRYLDPDHDYRVRPFLLPGTIMFLGNT